MTPRALTILRCSQKKAPERLCLGCGLRVDEPFAPIATGERKKLFYAAQKLLTFVLHEVSAQTLSEEEAALQIALRPLIANKDGHFVAAVISMFQSLLEGKTDCPISGVFGAGKTLSAAAMIAGLLVMDPSLKIMIVTKENVAAHAFVKHFLRLGLPESINCLVAFRNDVLRNKRVIVGCGGGFHQECQQPYSPVASWMEDTDVALNDEGQQYGNLDEASAIARAPRKCLVIWCGDHKQTPGGLRKTDEAKAFRRKLLRRPIALRGDTEHFQPNMLGKVVLRYLEGMDEPLINSIQAILRATMGGICLASADGIATLQSLCQEWVTQSEGAVQSKSVTSCAGMTAHFVLLAQTKVGFLSGGRSRRMKELPEKEVLAQLEEAYARATVALTRAQKLCIIMGPL